MSCHGGLLLNKFYRLLFDYFSFSWLLDSHISTTSLKKIGGHIYPNTIFDKLSGSPICNAQFSNEDNHYKSDGYPVHLDQMDEFTCLLGKVALLMGCLSPYFTQSIDFYLDLF